MTSTRASSSPTTPTSGLGVAGAGGAGLAYALGAYGLWGVLPVYFLLLAPAGPFEIVAWRVLFSLVFCAVLLVVTGALRSFLALLRQPRVVGTMGLAGAFIVVNWTVFISATLSGHVVEAALGYFINPIVTVLLGVVVLRERLRTTQWVAVGLSAVAVLVIAIGSGRPPVISLVLAFSFGLYGLVKKQVGGRVDAVGGLTLETLWIAPFAAATLIVLHVTGLGGGVVLGSVSVGHTVATIGTGVITAVPLLLFASATRRLPLTTVGLTQYLAPVLQFVVGVVVLGEHMSVARWVGFAVVWVASVVLTVDMVRVGRRSRRPLAVAPTT
ncbi:EamA family transporter RarD [Frigoribacterium sp. VKM Ac-2836]|uniref:EamA family transporter RarD n=1 Tax=Frigoribacterium sp. VKM Ac-2836 TaxID=2739014 RepID=UPI0015656F37|nr:EamA family transporter RarD [Frigoribacterium sp. VKM Ac-2836]